MHFQLSEAYRIFGVPLRQPDNLRKSNLIGSLKLNQFIVNSSSEILHSL